MSWQIYITYQNKLGNFNFLVNDEIQLYFKFDLM